MDTTLSLLEDRSYLYSPVFCASSTHQTTLSRLLLANLRSQRTHTSAKETLSHRPSSGQGSPGVGANTSLAAAAPGTPTLTRSSISGGRFRSALALAADDTWSSKRARAAAVHVCVCVICENQERDLNLLLDVFQCTSVRVVLHFLSAVVRDEHVRTTS